MRVLYSRNAELDSDPVTSAFTEMRSHLLELALCPVTSAFTEMLSHLADLAGAATEETEVPACCSRQPFGLRAATVFTVRAAGL